MQTNTYTYEMKMAILAAAAAIAIALLIPHSAHAKAKGDHIGAPTKEFATGTNKGDEVTTTTKALTGTATPIEVAPATPTLSIDEMRALIVVLTQVLEELLKKANAK